jgi:hypothetical protein
MELCGIASLPFAVGVYLPLSTSAPVFVGGVIRWIVDKWKRRSAGESEMSPGSLLSAGYIAGGATAGIVIALISVKATIASGMDVGEDLLGAAALSDWLPLIPFGLLAGFLLLVGGERLLRPSKD